ncbi:MAG: hypothetical protein WBW84_06385 [Acidobacteriaceae bacterium]
MTVDYAEGSRIQIVGFRIVEERVIEDIKEVKSESWVEVLVTRRKEYWPEALETAATAAPPELDRRERCAPTTTAPEESVTIPITIPVLLVNCA